MSKDRGDGSADLGQVAHRLDKDEVDPAGDERTDLLGKELLQLAEFHGSQRSEEFPGGTDIARDEDSVTIGDPAGDGCSGAVEFGDPGLQVMHPQPGAGTPKGVRGEPLGAGGGIRLMHVLDAGWLRRVPELGGDAGLEATFLKEPAIAAIEHRRAIGEQRREAVHHVPPRDPDETRAAAAGAGAAVATAGPAPVTGPAPITGPELMTDASVTGGCIWSAR